MRAAGLLTWLHELLRESLSPPDAVATFSPSREDQLYRVEIHDVEDYSHVVAALSESGASIRHTASKTRSLEEYFIELVREKEEAP